MFYLISIKNSWLNQWIKKASDQILSGKSNIIENIKRSSIDAKELEKRNKLEILDIEILKLGKLKFEFVKPKVWVSLLDKT